MDPLRWLLLWYLLEALLRGFLAVAGPSPAAEELVHFQEQLLQRVEESNKRFNERVAEIAACSHLREEELQMRVPEQLHGRSLRQRRCVHRISERLSRLRRGEAVLSAYDAASDIARQAKLCSEMERARDRAQRRGDETLMDLVRGLEKVNFGYWDAEQCNSVIATLETGRAQAEELEELEAQRDAQTRAKSFMDDLLRIADLSKQGEEGLGSALFEEARLLRQLGLAEADAWCSGGREANIDLQQRLAGLRQRCEARVEEAMESLRADRKWAEALLQEGRGVLSDDLMHGVAAASEAVAAAERPSNWAALEVRFRELRRQQAQEEVELEERIKAQVKWAEGVINDPHMLGQGHVQELQAALNDLHMASQATSPGCAEKGALLRRLEGVRSTVEAELRRKCACLQEDLKAGMRAYGCILRAASSPIHHLEHFGRLDEALRLEFEKQQRSAVSWQEAVDRAEERCTGLEESAEGLRELAGHLKEVLESIREALGKALELQRQAQAARTACLEARDSRCRESRSKSRATSAGRSS